MQRVVSLRVPINRLCCPITAVQPHFSSFTTITQTRRPRIQCAFYTTCTTMTDAPKPTRRMDNVAIFVCDIQEKFRPAIHEFDKVILTTKKVLRFAQALNLPIYLTTQNRARLGPTVSDLSLTSSTSNLIVEADKTKFSMWIPALVSKLPSPAPSCSIVLVGIESHICITQTALDAARAGHRVFVLADAVSSCNREEVPLALARLRAEPGIVVTTSESWMYEVVGDAGAAEFKALIGVVKEAAADTKSALAGLLPAAGAGGAGSKM